MYRAQPAANAPQGSGGLGVEYMFKQIMGAVQQSVSTDVSFSTLSVFSGLSLSIWKLRN